MPARSRPARPNGLLAGPLRHAWRPGVEKCSLVITRLCLGCPCPAGFLPYPKPAGPPPNLPRVAVVKLRGLKHVVRGKPVGA